MSLDGYVADERGGYDGIVPVPSPGLDTTDPLPFEAFLDDVDVVVMGEESGLYQDLVSDRFGDRVRLEQERIDWTWAKQHLPFGIVSGGT